MQHLGGPTTGILQRIEKIAFIVFLQVRKGKFRYIIVYERIVLALHLMMLR